MYAFSGEALFQEVLALSSSYLEIIDAPVRMFAKSIDLFYVFIFERAHRRKKKLWKATDRVEHSVKSKTNQLGVFTASLASWAKQCEASYG